MKKYQSFLLLCLLGAGGAQVAAQGFPANPTNWTMPVGGFRDNGIHYGYKAIFSTALNADDNGSESWGLVDINGDGLLDLVVPAQTYSASQRVLSFSPGNNPYWKVFLNTGAGFSASATNWSMPIGGFRDNGIHYGYNALSKTALGTDDGGSETWDLLDIDGDRRPDLVITAQTNAASARVTSYSPGTNPYWRVFFNNGSGFDASAVHWPVPVGGLRQGGIHYGYRGLAGTALGTDNGASETWNVVDLNADNLPDLVVSAQTNASSGRVSSYSPSSNAYWRIFYNNGSGFASASTHWDMPVGGFRDGNIHYGYRGISGLALPTDDGGSETWNLADLNGDGKLDLVVSAQTNAASARVTSYSPGNNPYWRVFYNSGTGFASGATYFYLPVGGARRGNIHYGYVNLAGVALPSDNGGSETWALNDLNGDGRLDMVISAQTNSASARVTSYSPGTNPYWRVFYNTGTAFSSAVTYWSLPVGGTRDNNIHYGYVALNGTALNADDNTSQTWNIADVSGDGQPDLIVSAQTNASSRVLSFSPSSNPYWKVYIAPTIVGTAAQTALSMQLSPNPASSTIRLDLSAFEPGSTYTIVGLNGSIQGQGQLDGPSTHIDIQDLASGMYFVRIQGTETIVRKFVKQ